MNLVVLVHGLTGVFLPSEVYRLVAQTTLAAASVPANIAEGHARNSRRDFANFLAIAKGSQMETETFLMVAIRLGYLQQTAAGPTLELITEISKMLTVLRQKLL